MWWLILLFPVILIALIMFLKVRLCLVYNGDFSVKIRVLFFNYALYPKKQKKPRPSDYTVAKLRKRQDKLNKKALKAKKKQPEPQSAQQEQPKKNKGEKLKEILELIKIVLENVMSPFGKYLKVEIVRMKIRLGTDDSAKTALLYGGVCQLVAYIVELFSNLTNVDVKKRDSITVIPDFLEGKTDADINITLGLRGWHAVSLAIKFFMGYIKKRNEKTLQKDIEKIK